MSFVIDLPQPVKARVEQEARRTGVSPAKFMADVITQNFPGAIDAEEQKQANAASIALLETWLEEARKPRTAEELAEAEDDLQQLMNNLNASRRESGECLLFSE